MTGATSLWIGRGLTGLFTLFMLIASVAPKLVGARVAHDSMANLGWDARYIPLIGVMELTFVLMHLYPRTSILGALLMTALLGGAIASQLRAGEPLFTHVLFGVYLGLAMWGGLWLRDPGLRDIIPFRALLS
jgi:hypothetical protein